MSIHCLTIGSRASCNCLFSGAQLSKSLMAADLLVSRVRECSLSTFAILRKRGGCNVTSDDRESWEVPLLVIDTGNEPSTANPALCQAFRSPSNCCIHSKRDPPLMPDMTSGSLLR